MPSARWLTAAAALAAAATLALAQQSDPRSEQDRPDRQTGSPAQRDLRPAPHEAQPSTAQPAAAATLRELTDASGAELRSAGQKLRERQTTLARIIETAERRHQDLGKPVYAEVALAGFSRTKDKSMHERGAQQDGAARPQTGATPIEPLGQDRQTEPAARDPQAARQPTAAAGAAGEDLLVHIGMLDQQGRVSTVTLRGDEIRQARQQGPQTQDPNAAQQPMAVPQTSGQQTAHAGGKAECVVRGLSTEQLKDMYQQLDQQAFSLADAAQSAEQESGGSAVIARADLVSSEELRQSRREMWAQPSRRGEPSAPGEQQPIDEAAPPAMQDSDARQLAFRVAIVDPQDRLVLATIRDDGRIVDMRPIRGVSYYTTVADVQPQPQPRPTPPPAPPRREQVRTEQRPGEPWIVGVYQIETFDITRASQVIGKSVRNYRNQDIGRVEDLAIDPETGEVRYAALSFGGFLGIGDKLFAVPLQVVDIRYDGDVVMNIDRETLETASGFDKTNWPTVADARFGGGRYRLAADAGRRPAGRVVQASDLFGMDVKNAQDEDLGEIDDLVIDENASRVLYAAINENGLLAGPDARITPVPVTALNMPPGDDDAYMQVTKQQLEQAPKLTRADLDRAQDLEFIARVYEFHGAQPYWRTTIERRTPRAPRRPTRDVEVEDLRPRRP